MCALSLTLIRVCRPERCFLEIAKLAHPVQVHVERFDSQATSDQVKHFLRSMLTCHHRELSRCQATAHDDYVHVFLLSQLDLYRRIRKLSNLHGMAAPLSSFAQSSRDRRCISWSNGKHNHAGMMYALIRAYCEDLFGFRYLWNDAEVDIFDPLFLYQVSPEPIPINDTLAVITEERARGCKIILAVTLIDSDRRSCTGQKN